MTLKAWTPNVDVGKKRTHDEARSHHKRSDQRNNRTGRWSSEEVALVDALVSAFDHGTLTMPHGVKLHEFLGDLLLCKSSRLTKKMKNAKLNTRSYTFSSSVVAGGTGFPAITLLQEQFLHSLFSDPAMHSELQFNMIKQWRTHFFNLCLQVGYELLDSKRWVASLEPLTTMNDCDHVVRKRRLLNPVPTSHDAIAAAPASNNSLIAMVSDASEEQPDQEDMDLLVDALGAASRSRVGSIDSTTPMRSRLTSMDFSVDGRSRLQSIDLAMLEAYDASSLSFSSAQQGNEGANPERAFLDQIMQYMEANPF